MATRRYKRGMSANVNYFALDKTVHWLKNVKLEDMNITAGVYADSGKYYDRNGKRVSLVKVAIINEYGAPRKKIPARPIFRHAKSALTKNNKIKEILKKQLIDKTSRISHAQKKVKVPEKTQHEIGQTAVEQLRHQVKVKTRPANAPATIKRKGFNDPLIHTRKMLREGFEYRIDGKKQSYRGSIR